MPSLAVGELYFATDQNAIYIGTSGGAVKLAPSTGGGSLEAYEVKLSSDYTLTTAGTIYSVLTKAWDTGTNQRFLVWGQLTIRGGSANAAFRATAAIDSYCSSLTAMVNTATGEGSCPAMGTGFYGYIQIALCGIIDTMTEDPEDPETWYKNQTRLKVATSLASSKARATPGDYMTYTPATKLVFQRIE